MVPLCCCFHPSGVKRCDMHTRDANGSGQAGGGGTAAGAPQDGSGEAAVLSARAFSVTTVVASTLLHSAATRMGW